MIKLIYEKSGSTPKIVATLVFVSLTWGTVYNQFAGNAVSYADDGEASIQSLLKMIDLADPTLVDLNGR